MEYVHHPINAFHLLQRTTTWIPKLKKLIPTLEFHFNIPSASDAKFGASNGIADLQEYHNISTLDLVKKGQITNYMTGETYLARSSLTSNEALQIATAARQARYFDNYVSWCEAALEVSKAENRDKKYIKHIKYVNVYIRVILFFTFKNQVFMKVE